MTDTSPSPRRVNVFRGWYKTADLEQRLVPPCPCLIDVPQVRQNHREVREHRSIGIGVQSPTGSAMRRVRKAMTTLQENAGGNELPKARATQPVCAATQHLRPEIVPRLAELLDLLGKRQRQLVRRSDQTKRPLPDSQRHEVLGPIDLLGQRALARGSRPRRQSIGLSWQPARVQA
jgi:hypothetical protein